MTHFNTTLFKSIIYSLTLIGTAAADPVERPVIPIQSVAMDDNAFSIWNNPATLGHAWQSSSNRFLLNRNSDKWDYSLTSKSGPIGIGLRYHQGWWTGIAGTSIPLGNGILLGVSTLWNSPSEESVENFFTWDMGMSWRPYSWLGLGGVVQNIGAKENGVTTKIQYGGVLRFAKGAIMAGGDAIQQTGEETVYQAYARLIPIPNLELNMSINSNNDIRAIAQINLSDVVMGMSAPLSASALDNASIYIGKNEDKKRIAGKLSDVAHFGFTRSLPYINEIGIFSDTAETYLERIERMQSAAEDTSLKGLLLELDYCDFSMAQAQEMQRIIQRAKQKGKLITVYMGNCSNNIGYFLASSADRIYMHPSADLNLIGLKTERMYYRGMLDAVGITPEFVKRSEYKSSPESFTNHEASEASRRQNSKLLDDLSKIFTETIAKHRNMPVNTAMDMIHKGPYSAQEALSKKLVDGLKYPDEMKSIVSKIYGKSADLIKDYQTTRSTEKWGHSNAIAVIPIVGVITSGESTPPNLLTGDRTSGSETIVRQINEARRSTAVKGVVLRVDSPGGSAFASEDIWRAIEKLKKTKKPIVVSMGSVAASGGYLVSAGATAILAEPSTITGSIGVYSGKFNTQKFFERIGLNVEIETRGRNAALFSTSKGWDEIERGKMQQLVDRTYARFKEKVSSGRKMKMDKVESLAKGRVWSGKAAKEKGLVDEIGGLHAAIERVKKEAKMSMLAPVKIITMVGGNKNRSSRWKSIQLNASANPILESKKQFQLLQSEHNWMLLPYKIDVK